MKDSRSKAELGCTWHFAPQEGGREDGPNDAMMQNFKSKPYSALVREAIQNSLDAVLDQDQPVKVEFTFGNLNAKNFNNFFNLKEHIKECGKYFNWQEKAVLLYSSMEKCFSSGALGNEIGYIKVADYNTKGMRYDPESSQSTFYAFARAAGVSSKIDQQSGGSFGFGKSAYFQLSPIATVFISSLTPDGYHAFEGVSWLCTHRYNGEKVSSVGYYDNNGGQPISEVDNIPSRFQRKEPGTSFYILGFKKYFKEIAKLEMIEEVLKSFWMAIYEKHLEVKIDDVEITSENLDYHIRNIFPDEIDKTQKTGHIKPLPYYLAVKETGQNPSTKSFTENLPTLGECTLYLRKAETPKDKIIYMRRPLMLVYGKRTQTSYGVFGTFVCKDPKGDKILQNMENPAHDEWKPSNWRDEDGRIVEKGNFARNEIHDFIMRCFASLFSNSQDTALEITGLDELLYIPEDLIETDADKDQEFGQPSGYMKDEGLSITTDIIDKNKVKQDNENQNIGSVRIVLPGSPDILDKESDNTQPVVGIGGHRKKRSKRKGGSPTAGNDFLNREIINPDGTVKIFVPIKFRVAAQNEDGKIYHSIIIHSDKEILDGEIELISIGEQTDDAVELVYTNNGNIKDNFLTNVKLVHGKSVIKVLFKDNMRHSIKLKAYENQ